MAVCEPQRVFGRSIQTGWLNIWGIYWVLVCTGEPHREVCRLKNIYIGPHSNISDQGVLTSCSDHCTPITDHTMVQDKYMLCRCLSEPSHIKELIVLLVIRPANSHSFRVRLQQLSHLKSGFRVWKSEKIAQILASFIHVIIEQNFEKIAPLSNLTLNCPIWGWQGAVSTREKLKYNWLEIAWCC